MKKYKSLITILFLIFFIMMQPAIPGFNLLPLNTSQTAYAADSQSPIVLYANDKSYVLNIGQEYYMDNVLRSLYGDTGEIAKIEFSSNVAGIFSIRQEYSRRYITANRSATEEGWIKVHTNGDWKVWEITVMGLPNYLDRTWVGSEVQETSVDLESGYKVVSQLPNDNAVMDGGWWLLDKDVTIKNPVKVTGDVHLVLRDGFTFSVQGLEVPEGSKLTIYCESDDSGKLVSDGAVGSSKAGIGGAGYGKAGNIIIKGGTIEAKGGYNCAGIGGAVGEGSGFEAISVYGGDLNITGGIRGAGIGGGYNNRSLGPITIYEGTINAAVLGSDDDAHGAAIGSGNDSDNNQITIHGGDITATASRNGAAIGGGNYGKGGVIVINGGKITAEGERNGAGIGGGYKAAGGSVTINGGEVTASSKHGAGIGGGYKGDSGTIIINDGVVNATTTLGSDGAGAAIGGGSEGNSRGITINGGEVYAESMGHGAAIGGGYDGDQIGDILIGENAHVEAVCHGYGAGIGGGDMGDSRGTITIRGHVFAETALAAPIGGGRESNWSSDGGRGYVVDIKETAYVYVKVNNTYVNIADAEAKLSMLIGNSYNDGDDYTPLLGLASNLKVTAGNKSSVKVQETSERRNSILNKTYTWARIEACSHDFLTYTNVNENHHLISCKHCEWSKLEDHNWKDHYTESDYLAGYDTCPVCKARIAIRKISFDPNDGSTQLEPEYVRNNTTYTLPPEDAFTPPEGKAINTYEVSIGKDDPLYFKASYRESVVISADTLIKPKWDELRYSVIVNTYEGDLDKGTVGVHGQDSGDTQVLTMFHVAEGGSMTAWPAEGYAFDYWDIYENGPNGFSKKSNENPYVVPANKYGKDQSIILIAHYKKRAKYTVNFEATSVGTMPDSDKKQQVYDGAKAIRPEDPVPNSDYNSFDLEFIGWYKDQDYQEEFDFDEPITKGMTLYAGYKYDMYIYAIEQNSGNYGGGEIEYTHGQYTSTRSTKTTVSDIRFGDEITLKAKPYANHSFSEWKKMTMPSGETSSVSSDSDYTFTVTGLEHYFAYFNAHVHTPGTKERDNYVEPSCTTAGSYDEVVRCTECEKELSREHFDIDALDHNWSSWEETVDEDGHYKTRECSRCGKIQCLEIPDFACEHNRLRTIARIEPTCTEVGYEEYFQCEYCGIYLVHEEDKLIEVSSANLDEYMNKLTIPATGHTPGEAARENVKEATCSQEGSYEEVVKCSVCGEEISRETKKIEKKPHSLTETKAADATCTQAGNTAYWTCSECGRYFSDAEGETEIEKDFWIIKATGHSWDDGTVTKEATATAEGEKTFKCTVCGETKTEPIDKLPAPTPSDDDSAKPSGGGSSTPADEQMGEDGTPAGKGASAAAAEKAIMNASSDEGPAGTKFAPLKVKSTKQTKNSVKLTWTKVKGAKKYVIYGNQCGKTKKMKKLGTTTGKSKTIKKAAGKKLKKGKYYKFIIVAIDKNNKVVSTSKVVHAATKGGKVGNHKKVTVTKAVITKAKKLKKGKSLKLNAKLVKASSKLKVQNHRKVSYESSNKKIATVSKKGVVKGKKKGTCYIYAYAQNGVYKKIKVTVK